MSRFEDTQGLHKTAFGAEGARIERNLSELLLSQLLRKVIQYNMVLNEDS